MIQGGLLEIAPDGVIGWAWNPQQPEQSVRVRLLAGPHVLGEALADRFDDPRVRDTRGPGVPGFRLRLTAPPSLPFPLMLTVQTLAGEMLGQPFAVATAAALAPAVSVNDYAHLEGNVDGLYNHALKGWARDNTALDRAVTVELIDSGRFLAATEANLRRDDLRVAGLHSGLYGFSFELPVALLDGKSHSLQVRVAGTEFSLRGGPIAWGPLATSALMEQVSSLQIEVASLRALVDGLVAPDGLVQRRLLKTLSERVAAMAEIQRDLVEREMAAMRQMAFSIRSPDGRSPEAAEQYNVPAVSTPAARRRK